MACGYPRCQNVCEWLFILWKIPLVLQSTRRQSQPLLKILEVFIIFLPEFLGVPVTGVVFSGYILKHCASPGNLMGGIMGPLCRRLKMSSQFTQRQKGCSLTLFAPPLLPSLAHSSGIFFSVAQIARCFLLTRATLQMGHPKASSSL
jgi:hypothetical protein